MNHIIPYGRQTITDEDIEAVVETLKSPWLTQGPKIQEFEKAFAEYVGAKYAVSVSSGTAALHLSAITMKIKPEQKVITTPITFSATANAIRYCDREVVFADIDPSTFLLDINKVRELIEAAPAGTFAGIIPVDMAGYPVNLEKFRNLADEHNLWIIEDACHAPGGFFTDKNGVEQKCGNGVYADLAVFSFHPVKHIAAGEGGMVTTNDEELYKHLINLRTHGIQQDRSKLVENHGVWYYEMQELGFNYRFTDIAASLALSQLKRAEAGIKKRKEIATVYDNAFKDTAIKTPYIESNANHAFHLYIIHHPRRDELINHLRSKNIFAQVHYIPVHLMQYYKQFGWKKGDLPIAEKYYESCLSIPIYPGLTSDEQEFVINTIKNFFNI